MIGMRRVLAATAACGILLASAATSVSAATSASAGRPLPAHVYAPYFETWRQRPISSIARMSGARYFTLAFIQATRRRPCVPTWNGDPRQPTRPAATWPTSRSCGHAPRRRDPVVRRLQRRPCTDRDRGWVQEPRQAGAGVRVGDRDLRRDPAGHGRGGPLARPRGRDRSPEPCAGAGRAVGEAALPAAPGLLHAPGRAGRAASPTAWRCCATRSATTRGWTSSTS